MIYSIILSGKRYCKADKKIGEICGTLCPEGYLVIIKGKSTFLNGAYFSEAKLHAKWALQHLIPVYNDEIKFKKVVIPTAKKRRVSK